MTLLVGKLLSTTIAPAAMNSAVIQEMVSGSYASGQPCGWCKRHRVAGYQPVLFKFDNCATGYAAGGARKLPRVIRAALSLL